MLLQTGCSATPTVFLFSDSQMKHESFLEDINNVLNTGMCVLQSDAPVCTAAQLQRVCTAAGLWPCSSVCTQLQRSSWSARLCKSKEPASTVCCVLCALVAKPVPPVCQSITKSCLPPLPHCRRSAQPVCKGRTCEHHGVSYTKGQACRQGPYACRPVGLLPGQCARQPALGADHEPCGRGLQGEAQEVSGCWLA